MKFITVAILFLSIASQAKEGKMKEQVQEVLNSKEGMYLLHNTFSSMCFNKTWGFIDKKELSAEDIEDMIATSYASLWHWKQRHDCKAENLSIAYWQLGRVHCLAKKADEAKSFGEKCLKVSIDGKLDPFYIGYAYEVLINAAILKKDFTEAKNYLKLGQEQLALITNKDNKKYLKADLDKLAKQIK